MKVVGIIAEYNPFHNGHLYQLNHSKKLTGSDFAVVIMSGDFVQRGTPAFLSKFKRAEMALACGADLVIELPVRYATSSAEYFAKGAVSLLDNLGADCFCFGSESGDIHSLSKLAKYIHKDCDDFNKAIADFAKTGLSYPSARKEALLSCFHDMDKDSLLSIISAPNNILGIEYLKALQKFNSNITPFTIKRVCTEYHDFMLSEKYQEEMMINSASAIRNVFSTQSNLETIRTSIPPAAFSILETTKPEMFPIVADDLSEFLFYKLQETAPGHLTDYMDISPDLANAIQKWKNEYESFTQFSKGLKSKQITQTRINRALLHLILNLNTYSIQGMNPNEITPYIRVLAFRKEASAVLKRAKKNQAAIITKPADAKNLLSKNAYQLFSEDISATSLYQRIVFQKSGIKLPNEFTKTPIIY